MFVLCVRVRDVSVVSGGGANGGGGGGGKGVRSTAANSLEMFN